MGCLFQPYTIEAGATGQEAGFHHGYDGADSGTGRSFAVKRYRVIVETIRAIVRPLCTLLFVISWQFTTITIIFNEIKVGAEYWIFSALTWGVVVWWYGDRTYFKKHPLDIKPKLN